MQTNIQTQAARNSDPITSHLAAGGDLDSAGSH